MKISCSIKNIFLVGVLFERVGENNHSKRVYELTHHSGYLKHGACQ